MENEQKDSLYKMVLDDTNQLIQVSFYQDFSMIYANHMARNFTNHRDMPYKGEKCYNYMMGLYQQCPFCPMRQMKEEEACVSEIDNGEQVFIVKTKRMEWEGQDAFVEYAMDITTARRAQQIFESQMQTLIQSIPDAQGIFHLNLTQNKWISSNGVSANVEKLKRQSDVDAVLRSIAEFIPDQDQKENFIRKYNREALIREYHHGKTEIITETKSLYDDGSVRWARLTARLLMNPVTGDLECIFFGMDISEEKKYQEQLALSEEEKEQILEKAKRDILTDVYSKKAFVQMAEEYLKSKERKCFAIIFLDLDHFKNVNDKLGHLVGDQVIMDTAEKLQNIFSNKDIISRFGGDEFCILVKDIPKATFQRKIDYMLDKLKGIYQDEENCVQITASIGAVYVYQTTNSIEELMQEADMELYRAKRNGRDRYCIKYDVE